MKSFPKSFRKLFLETLECRRVFANGFQSAPGVPVAASFVAGGQTHGFEITSVGGDSNADGLVNSRTLSLSGKVTGPKAELFTDTHTGLTLDAKLVSSGLSVGKATNFVGNKQTATFSNMQITLPPGDGIYSVRLEFSRDGFGTVPIQLASAAAAVDLVGTFTLDQTPPTVTSISQPKTPRNKPVSTLDVVLSETVSSFPVSALGLKRNGIDVSLSGVSISLINGTTYQVAGLTDPTANEGTYAFSVNPLALLDSAGNSGTGSAVSAQFEVDLKPPNIQAPQLDPKDDSGNGIQDGAADGITTQKSDLSYSVSSDASVVEFQLQQLVRGSFIDIGIPNIVKSETRVFETDFISNAGFEDGTYRVQAKATKSTGASALSFSTLLVIDNSAPVAPTGLRTASGITTLNAAPTILFNSVENGAAVELFRNSVLVGTRLIPTNATKALDSIKAPESGNGVFRYQLRQIDQAGNVGPLSEELAIAFDATPPVIDTAAATKFRMAQGDLSEPNSVLPVLVTTSSQPTFLARISDQAFADRNNIIKVELLVDGVVQAIDNADFAITPSTTGFTSVSVRPSSPLAVKKVLSLQLRVTDQAGNVTTSSSNVQVFVNQVGAATQNAPGTPIFNEKWYIGANFTSPSARGTFTVEVDQAIPAATIISINGNGATDPLKRFEVVKSVTNASTGKTVLTLKTALTADVSSSTPLMWLRPWTTTFDKTTQTTWLTMEDGVSVANFDPTNGNVKFYSIGLRDPLTGVARYGDPHGVTFDFNSHLTPRVWFVYRNENLDRDLPDFGDPTKPFDQNATGPGTVAYLDVATNTYWSFEIDEALFAQQGSPADFDLAGTHAIFVDTRGHVWLTTETSIIEIDTSRLTDGKPTGTLTSSDGTIILHKLPAELGDTGSKPVPFQPHGIQVIVDQRTGKQYVFIADGDANSGTARTVLLQPGTNGEPDQWKEWNFDALLLSEANPLPKDVPPSATLFLAVDDNETPGIPEDDRLIAASPGALANQGAKGIMRVLDLSSILGPIVQSDLARSSGKALPSITEPTTAPVTTYRLPGIPGSSKLQPFASNQVPLLDRAGNIYYVDAIGGVGRFNANDPNSDFLLSQSVVGLKNYTSQSISRTINFDATQIEPVRFTAKVVGSPGTKIDRSTAAGLDQYDATIAPNATQGGNGAGGMFRGALSAENSLYGSNSSSDYLSTTLFAESNRRQLAVVASPLPLPDGARVGGRVALQVLRDGSVVLTGRGDGELLDVQVNLTKELFKAGKIASFDDGAVIGDMAALGNPDGSIEALGRLPDGRLIRYTFNPPSKAWKSAELKNVAFWSANIKLTIPGGQLAAEDPAPAPGIGFSVTTSSGHLIVIPLGGNPVDLSAAAGSPAVYAGVGGLRVGEKLRFYGANQTGSVVEYATDLNLGSVSTRTLVLPNNTNARDTRMLRNIRPLLDGSTIHLFGTDGVSQLVHYELDQSGNVTLAENVTQLVQKSGEVYGYFSFEKAYGGRVYTYVSAIKLADGTLRVYGTNGGELIEFTRSTSGTWRVGNLTNDIMSTNGVNSSSRIPANAVFGAPNVYEDKSKERHILQINADGEIVEYYMLAGDSQKRFHSQNVNLRLGNDSLVTNLRFRSTSPQSTAVVSSNVTGSLTSSRTLAFDSSLDVNADGELSPLDALLVINYLNKRTDGKLVAAGESTDNRLDVNDDGQISPLDALLLINQLNRKDAGAGGEGESAETASIEATATDLAFAELGQWENSDSNLKKRPFRR